MADELIRANLVQGTGELETAIRELAQLRAELPDLDGVALADNARAELEQRAS
ncbi:MAG: hypothetical protein WAN93_11635 [Solirubrobacteraceae bacterium]